MKALVLCGGLPQIALIEELKRRGIQALLADMNPLAPAVPYADKFFQVSTLDFDGVRKVAQEESVDYVISVCADQMILTAAKVSEDLSLPFYIDYQTAKNVSSKECMKRIFAESGIPTSKYIIKENIAETDIEDLTFPLIVKPVDSYGSRGVKKVSNYEKLVVAFENAVKVSRTKTALIEEYVDGDEWSVDVYVENGKAIVQCISRLDKVRGSEKFIICRAYYSSNLTNDNKVRVEAVAQKIADTFHLVDTPMLIQMKADGETLSVIEFCARTGGGTKFLLIDKVTGFNVVNAILELTLGNKPHVEQWKDNSFIVDEFLYCQPGVFDHIEGFVELKDAGVISEFGQLRTAGHEFKTIESSGDRVGYFSIVATDEEELYKAHKMVSDKIKAMSSTGDDMLRHDIINTFHT